MRILILANHDIGLYKFRRELIEELVRDHEVSIALPPGEYCAKLEALGCQMHPFDFARRGMNPFADFMQISRYKKLLKQVKPDVVLTYTIKPNVYGGIACQKMKIPYIANVTGLGTSIENGGLLSKLVLALYRYGLRKAKCVFFQNPANADFFQSKNVISGKSRIIPGSGVNLEFFEAKPYPEDAGESRLLFVGRIMKDKGIEEFLEAIRKVRQGGDNVIGDIVGPCEEDYQPVLKCFEDEGVIRYYGLQDDMRPFYAKAHAVVLPSYHEGKSNVLLEASASARPIVTTRVPGCQEICEEGVTGFLCAPQDAESLAEAIAKLIHLPREMRQEMGAKARQKMEKEYDRKLVIQAYWEEIKDVR